VQTLFEILLGLRTAQYLFFEIRRLSATVYAHLFLSLVLFNERGLPLEQSENTLEFSRNIGYSGRAGPL